MTPWAHKSKEERLKDISDYEESSKEKGKQLLKQAKERWPNLEWRQFGEVVECNLLFDRKISAFSVTGSDPMKTLEEKIARYRNTCLAAITSVTPAE